VAPAVTVATVTEALIAIEQPSAMVKREMLTVSKPAITAKASVPASSKPDRDSGVISIDELDKMFEGAS
jgi:hypothetical protein